MSENIWLQVWLKISWFFWWHVWWWPRMLLIFFRKWQRVWNFKRASVKNPPGGISGQHQQKWIKKCEEKRLLNLFCLLTARVVGVNIIICERALSGQCEDIYYKRACPLGKVLLKFTSSVPFCRPSNPLFAKLLYLFSYKLSDFYTN